MGWTGKFQLARKLVVRQEKNNKMYAGGIEDNRSRGEGSRGDETAAIQADFTIDAE